MRLHTCAMSKHTCVAALMFRINTCGLADDTPPFPSINITDQSSEFINVLVFFINRLNNVCTAGFWVLVLLPGTDHFGLGRF